MKTITKLKISLIPTILSASVVFAQGGMPPPPQGDINATANINSGTEQPGRGGFFQKMFGEIRGERKELRDEYREEVRTARDEMRNQMNASGTATGTAWKEIREDIKNARGEWRDGMQQLHEDMRGRVASITANLTDAQLAQIGARVGLTAETIRAQLASGTPLHEIVKDKLTKEEIGNIVPMLAENASSSASNTRRFEDRGPRGFFNQFRMKLFGSGDTTNTQLNADINASSSVNTTQEPVQQIRNFFKRFFNF